HPRQCAAGVAASAALTWKGIGCGDRGTAPVPGTEPVLHRLCDPIDLGVVERAVLIGGNRALPCIDGNGDEVLIDAEPALDRRLISPRDAVGRPGELVDEYDVEVAPWGLRKFGET